MVLRLSTLILLLFPMAAYAETFEVEINLLDLCPERKEQLIEKRRL